MEEAGNEGGWGRGVGGWHPGKSRLFSEKLNREKLFMWFFSPLWTVTVMVFEAPIKWYTGIDSHRFPGPLCDLVQMTGGKACP